MSNQILSEYDLIQAISGVDAHGAGKCTVTIQPQRCNADGNVVNTDVEYMTDKPIIQMFKQAGGFVLVDFVFESIEDIDLKRMYEYLRDFFDSTNSIREEDNEFPVLAISIVPEAFAGEYWTMGLNPVFYTLAPDDMKGEPKILRLLFSSDEDSETLPNFFFMKSDETELAKMREEDDLDEPYEDDDDEEQAELD